MSRKKKELAKIEKLYTRYNQCRDLEIDRFWKNSVFVWVFLALCFAAFGAMVKDYYMPMRNLERIDDDSYYLFLSIISGIALFLSCVWVWMARGLKAWYEVFEMAIWDLEINKNEIGYPKEYTINNYWTIKDQNSNYDKLLSSAPYSSSKIVILIGHFLVLVWLMAFGYSLWSYCDCYLYFDFCLEYINWKFIILFVALCCLIIFCRWLVKSTSLRNPKAQEVFVSIKTALARNKISNVQFEVTNSKVKFWGEQKNDVKRKFLKYLKPNIAKNNEIEYPINKVITYFKYTDEFRRIVRDDRLSTNIIFLNGSNIEVVGSVNLERDLNYIIERLNCFARLSYKRKPINDDQVITKNNVIIVPTKLFSKCCFNRLYNWICKR